ncbi:hypothetical protein CCHL11_02988 [Colletotrichum chlorophyti]|uniref:Uncharacterized protein n=1 Tax=Colletotrichum chlorophyti TaxID=708187 RepID=A0A1Q8RGD8_9PEZI|nr:hypothetical protein CCHL11_02988 [Colletotrichum chlorophyti]
MAESNERIEAWQVHRLERSQSFDVDSVKKRSSGSAPLDRGRRLSRSPSWLKSPSSKSDCTRKGTNAMEITSSPWKKSQSGREFDSVGPEATNQSEPTVSFLRPESTDQAGSTTEMAFQRPKLRKVTKITAVEVEKEPLPWMQRPLRRVQKEQNSSRQVKESKSVDVELWRSQLRKVATPGESSNHNRTEVYDSCPNELSSILKRMESGSASRSVEDVDAVQQKVQSDPFTNPLKQKRFDGIRMSASGRPSTSTSMARIGSETVIHASESLKGEETIVDEPNPAVHGWSPISNSEIEKEHYLALAAEVRHMKAEIVSRERLNAPGLVDVGVNVDQGDEEGLGVEGLTIVMHLKGKDDLIINTNLMQAS